MADSRKFFMVLAMSAALSVSSYAADPFTCDGAQSANKHLRAGGITELLGDATLKCGGGLAGVNGVLAAQFAVQISGASTVVTNKYLGAYDSEVGGFPISAAAVVTTSDGVIRQVSQGFVDPDSPDIVSFPSVTLPTGTNSTVRFANIRVATPTLTGSASQNVYALITTPTEGFQIGGVTTQTPGVVYPSLKFSVTSCNGGTAPSLSYQQCIAQPKTPGALSFGIKFAENISTGAFKINESGPSFTGPASIATFDGASTFTGAAPQTIDDVTNYPTRLMARFSHVPTGVKIFVTDQELHGVASLSTTGAQALFVKDAKTTGEGAYAVPDAGVGPVTCPDTAITPGPTLVAALKDATTGEYYAVWEVKAANAAKLDKLVFGVQVVYEAGAAAKSTEAVKIIGEFAPISETLQVATKDASDKLVIPRFLASEEEASLGFTIAPCITNLLFPYVTNQQGYETGIALVNTSKDNVVTDEDADPTPFGTKEQSGKCNLYLFGNDADGAVADTYTTANEIQAGDHWAENLSAIHGGFQGYIIARCDFQYAHGLAFLTLMDNGTASFSEYLALVIPDATTRPAVPFSENPGTGEQLAF